MRLSSIFKTLTTFCNSDVRKYKLWQHSVIQLWGYINTNNTFHSAVRKCKYCQHFVTQIKGNMNTVNTLSLICEERLLLTILFYLTLRKYKHWHQFVTQIWGNINTNNTLSISCVFKCERWSWSFRPHLLIGFWVKWPIYLITLVILKT